MSNPTVYELNLQAVSDAVDEVSGQLLELDGRRFINDDGRKNEHHASLARDLLRLSDELTLAAALVKQQYWAMRA